MSSREDLEKQLCALINERGLAPVMKARRAIALMKIAMAPERPDLETIADFGRRLRISRSTIHRWSKAGKIRIVRVGGAPRIVDDAMTQNGTEIPLPTLSAK